MSLVVFLLLYVLIIFAALFVAIQWLKAQRRPKLPFKPERTRLRRGPGESLQRRVQLMDENQLYLLFALMAVPILIGVGLLAVLQSAGFATPGVRMGISLASALVIVVLGAWYLAQEVIRRGNHYLGWFGERMTAEELEPLREQGWRIFHDVPGERGGHEFNIDHVLVGPGGVYSIETKMRRKGSARPGRKDHEVAYDGQRLSWPWTEDTYGLAQAARNAEWLRDWLAVITGERLEVNPILVFPCWYVTPPNARHPVSVVALPYLAGFVTMRNDVLNPTQVDLFARQLDQRCRDVEY
ncbi:MAG TPA: nuclease-related domain-containing protein [Candidatus Didemnitutus sp.]|nr:nuclease-related domain-containing protein [Candidatus Didemnitutus sp.]